MEFLTVKEASNLWGISERRILRLIKDGRIPGSIKNGMLWCIPKDTHKPIDKRCSFSKSLEDKKIVVIAGINSEIGIHLASILLQAGFKIIGLYQKNSLVPKELYQKDISILEVDYFKRENLLAVTNSIQEDIFGFVFMEIYFQLEDVLDFDYEQFEKSFQVNVFAANLLVRELVNKMNYESSIVMVNSIEAYRGSFGASAYASSQAAKVNLVQTYANIFTEMYGVRINSVMSGWIGGVMENDTTFNKAKDSIPMKRLGSPYEIADDIFLMLTRHKYTNGSSLVSDGGYLSMDAQARTEDLDSGKFYKILDKYFRETEKGSSMWIISTMMANEWNEDPAERKFIESNFEAAERGVEIHRIFLFSKKQAPLFKTNPYIKRYLASQKIISTFVDLDELKMKNEPLLGIIQNGWIGIDDYALLVDLPSDGTSRGYVTLNKQEIEKAKNCFLELEKMEQPLKDILK